jgi:hypothetical protein
MGSHLNGAIGPKMHRETCTPYLIADLPPFIQSVPRFISAFDRLRTLSNHPLGERCPV